MNQNVRNEVAALSFTSKGRLRARLFHGGLALLTALCFLILATSAKAACGSFGPSGLRDPIKLPDVAQADFDFHSPNPPIVGLWHVIYTNGADESIFNDTFDTWHSDGTEFENAFLAPAGGNVCEGVWRLTSLRSVTLHHVGWLFNPST